MKAAYFRRYGAADVVGMREVPRPGPVRDGEILIRVRASECTKSDAEMRGFNYAVKWFTPPLRLVIGLFRPRPSFRVLGKCVFRF